uniref:Transposase n=1 Tax=Macrostomum lignano TaxID=282301 RepID=A0A1I8IDW1_9PLAT
MLLTPHLAWPGGCCCPRPIGWNSRLHSWFRQPRHAKTASPKVTLPDVLVEWLPLEGSCTCSNASHLNESLTILLLPSTDEGEGPAEGKADRVRMK